MFARIWLQFGFFLSNQLYCNVLQQINVVSEQRMCVQGEALFGRE